MNIMVEKNATENILLGMKIQYCGYTFAPLKQSQCAHLNIESSTMSQIAWLQPDRNSVPVKLLDGWIHVSH